MIYSSGEIANGIPSQLLRGWGSMHVAGYVLRGHLQKRERAAFPRFLPSPKEAKGGKAGTIPPIRCRESSLEHALTQSHVAGELTL
jgi:hypothetical protein